MDDNQPTVSLQLADEAATQRLGAFLAGFVAPGMHIHLRGPLGAGKTTLVRALLQALGHSGRVKSPSYTLVEPYAISRLYLYHFDFYRFQDPNEWIDSGFRELFASDAICLVEWPDNAAGLLPNPDLDVEIEPDQNGRRITLSANSDWGGQCVLALRSQGAFA